MSVRPTVCRYGLKPGSAVLAEEKHQPIYAELVKDYKVAANALPIAHAVVVVVVNSFIGTNWRTNCNHVRYGVWVRA